MWRFHQTCSVLCSKEMCLTGKTENWVKSYSTFGEALLHSTGEGYSFILCSPLLNSYRSRFLIALAQKAMKLRAIHHRQFIANAAFSRSWCGRSQLRFICEGCHISLLRPIAELQFFFFFVWITCYLSCIINIFRCKTLVPLGTRTAYREGRLDIILCLAKDDWHYDVIWGWKVGLINLITITTGSVSALFSLYLTNYQECPEMKNARQTTLQRITGLLGYCVFQVASGQSVVQALPLSRRRSVIWLRGKMAVAVPPSSLLFLCLSHISAWLQDLDVPQSTGI